MESADLLRVRTLLRDATRRTVDSRNKHRWCESLLMWAALVSAERDQRQAVVRFASHAHMMREPGEQPVEGTVTIYDRFLARSSTKSARQGATL
jgi:hypothetical protein